MAKIEKIIKNMIAGKNLLFIAMAITIGIIILNLYSRLVQSEIPGWLGVLVVLVSTVFGIFISGWMLGLRRQSMHFIEFYLTILLIAIVMLLLQAYYPQLLFGATTFTEPSREALAGLIGG
jgi:hypothetical protein